MHIPDGFLSNGVATAMNLISGAVIVYTVKKVRQDFNTAKALLGAAIAAFIFGLQMLNCYSAKQC